MFFTTKHTKDGEVRKIIFSYSSLAFVIFVSFVVNKVIA